MLLISIFSWIGAFFLEQNHFLAEAIESVMYSIGNEYKSLIDERKIYENQSSISMLLKNNSDWLNGIQNDVEICENGQFGLGKRNDD